MEDQLRIGDCAIVDGEYYYIREIEGDTIWITPTSNSDEYSAIVNGQIFGDDRDHEIRFEKGPEINRVPDDIVYLILSRLPQWKALEICRTTPRFKKCCSDWNRILLLKWPNLEPGRSYTQEEALEIDENLENSGRDAFQNEIEAGRMVIVQYMINRLGLDSPEMMKIGLKSAIHANRFDMIEYFIDRGADIGEEIVRASRGNLERLRYLVESGADLNRYGEMALVSAKINGAEENVQYLISQGVNPEAWNRYTGRMVPPRFSIE